METGIGTKPFKFKCAGCQLDIEQKMSGNSLMTKCEKCKNQYLMSLCHVCGYAGAFPMKPDTKEVLTCRKCSTHLFKKCIHCQKHFPWLCDREEKDCCSLECQLDDLRKQFLEMDRKIDLLIEYVKYRPGDGIEFTAAQENFYKSALKLEEMK